MELFKVLFLISFAFLPNVKCFLWQKQFGSIRVQIDATREDRRVRINFYDQSGKDDSQDSNYLIDKRLLQSIMLDKNFDTDTQIVGYSVENVITLNGRNNHNLEIRFLQQSTRVSIQFTHKLQQNQQSQDCFYLNIGQVSWFGGPEDQHQYWPIEKSTFKNYSYVTKRENYCAIAERYWLNSRGVAILIDDDVPLFIDQNTKEQQNQLCFTAQLKPPYYNPPSTTKIINFSYGVIIAKNMRTAHMEAIKILGRPNQIPDEMMARYPIWSTWALYKRNINDSVVRDFVGKIVENGFNHGQIEIDDNWEKCYGSLTFDENKFPNVKNLTDHIGKLGFRTTLWIHPFINKDCVKWYKSALQYNYIRSPTTWWNSKKDEAGIIDFTWSSAKKWFIQNLVNLKQNTGIYSFKFDAGESSWTPQDPKYTNYFNPNEYTTNYINLAKTFGSGIEVRTGSRTQSHGLYVRMLDKDTNWSYDNGLPTLITTLLQMNLAGYSFVLPDMIGGNGYNHQPDKELFIRWMQTTVFMPSMQFSYVPWLYDSETVELTKKYVNLHTQWADYIIERFELAVITGEPVNPPLWWLDSEDIVARQINDQFLLGDRVIVAPVVVQGQTERDIYLPTGTWKDGNTQEVHEGPKWLLRYPASLRILPYFYKD